MSTTYEESKAILESWGATVACKSPARTASCVRRGLALSEIVGLTPEEMYKGMTFTDKPADGALAPAFDFPMQWWHCFEAAHPALCTAIRAQADEWKVDPAQPFQGWISRHDGAGREMWHGTSWHTFEVLFDQLFPHASEPFYRRATA